MEESEYMYIERFLRTAIEAVSLDLDAMSGELSRSEFLH